MMVPTLGEFLFGRLNARVVKRSLFRSEVSLSQVIVGGLYVFAQAAVLGRSMREKLDVLCELTGLVPSADPAVPSLAHYLRETEARLLTEMGRDATSFHAYWTHAHYPQFALSSQGRIQVEKLQGETVQLEDVLEDMTWYAAEGLVFGATFPDLAARMYQESFEAGIDAYRRADMQAFGLEVPNALEAERLDEMERIVLQELSEYLRRYFPEVTDLLDLAQLD